MKCDEASGLGNREIGAGHARFGVEEIRPRVATHYFGKVVRVIVTRLRLDCTCKNFRNIVPQLVDRRDDDMAGRFIIELLDTLAKVGLDYSDASRLQVRTHVTFLSQHGFALDQGLRAARRENAIDDLIMLTGIARPMHVGAVCLGLCFKLLKVIGKMGKRVLFYGGGEISQFLPFRNAVCLPVALKPEIP